MPRTTDIPRNPRALLRRMPKADLHRHLGGCLGLADQQAAADAIWQALAPAERDQAMAVAAPLLARDAAGQAQQAKQVDSHDVHRGLGAAPARECAHCRQGVVVNAAGRHQQGRGHQGQEAKAHAGGKELAAG